MDLVTPLDKEFRRSLPVTVASWAVMQRYQLPLSFRVGLSLNLLEVNNFVYCMIIIVFVLICKLTGYIQKSEH